MLTYLIQHKHLDSVYTLNVSVRNMYSSVFCIISMHIYIDIYVYIGLGMRNSRLFSVDVVVQRDRPAGLLDFLCLSKTTGRGC